MKISDLMTRLEVIKGKFGDIAVTGGAMSDDVPLSEVSVTDTSGREIWPFDHRCNQDDEPEVDGVFFQ